MLECSEHYDAFMLQARGEISLAGNVSLVGEFVEKPDIAAYVTCQDNQVKCSWLELISIEAKTVR